LLAHRAGFDAVSRPLSSTTWSRRWPAGYRLKDMIEQFDAKAAGICAMFSNQFEPKRTAEIRERFLEAGLLI
jgi:hypothetical protein